MTAYGLTNAAKHRIYWVSSEARGRSSLRVFDYGCGTGSDWPEILRSHPSIVVFGYEPDVNAATRARGRMAGLSASILSETELQSAQLEADVIGSLSVFEHVVNRVGYLATARANLAPHGTFFLNYDDGHFRNDLRLESPRKWRQPLRAFGRHLVSPVRARRHAANP